MSMNLNMEKEITIISGSEARMEFINQVTYNHRDDGLKYFQANTALRGWRGTPRKDGWVVYLVDHPYRWMYWYKTFRGAKRAKLNFEKTFFN